MNEPTIEEQIAFQKVQIDCTFDQDVRVTRTAILASLERLKRLDSQPVPVGPAKSQYDKFMAGVEEKDPVERLRFFCSLAMRGQDWLDVEPFFDALTALAKQDRVDAERWRKGVEDGEFPIHRDGVYMHVCRTTGKILTGGSYNEVIDRARSAK